MLGDADHEVCSNRFACFQVWPLSATSPAKDSPFSGRQFQECYSTAMCIEQCAAISWLPRLGIEGIRSIR